MRLIKAFCLAAIAAVAAMAFIGVGGASADAICNESGATVNGTGQIICNKAATLLLIHGTATDPKLNVNATTSILCSALHVHALVHSKALGVLATLSDVLFTWLGPCIQKGLPCNEAATVESPGSYTGEVHYVAKAYKTVAEGEAIVLVKNPETIVKLTCLGIPLTCKYATATTVSGTANNGTGNLTVSQAIPSPGGLCPAGTEEAVVALSMAKPGAGEEGKEGAKLTFAHT